MVQEKKIKKSEVVRRPPRLYYSKKKDQYYVKVLGKKKYLKIDEGMTYKEILSMIIKFFLNAKKKSGVGKKNKKDKNKLKQKGIEPIPAHLQSVGWSSSQARRIVEDATRDARYLREMVLELNMRQPQGQQLALPGPAGQQGPQLALPAPGAAPAPQKGDMLLNIDNMKQKDFFDLMERLVDESPNGSLRRFAASVLSDKEKAKNARDLEIQFREAKLAMEALQAENEQKEADMAARMNQIRDEMKQRELEADAAVAALEAEKKQKEDEVRKAVKKLKISQAKKEEELKARMQKLEEEFAERETMAQAELMGLREERAAQERALFIATEEANLAREEADINAAERETLKQQMEEMKAEAEKIAKNRDDLIVEVARTGTESAEQKRKLDEETKKLQEIAAELTAKQDELHDVEYKKEKLKDRLSAYRGAIKQNRERQRAALEQRLSNTAAGRGSILDDWKVILGPDTLGTSGRGDTLYEILQETDVKKNPVTHILDDIVRSYDMKVWDEKEAFQKAKKEIEKLAQRRRAGAPAVDPDEDIYEPEADEVEQILDETKEIKKPSYVSPADRRTELEKIEDYLKTLDPAEKAKLLGAPGSETQAKTEGSIPQAPPLQRIPTPPPFIPTAPLDPNASINLQQARAAAAPKPADKPKQAGGPPPLDFNADMLLKQKEENKRKKEQEKKDLEEEAKDPEKKKAGDARRAKEKAEAEAKLQARLAEKARLEAERQKKLDEEAEKDPVVKAAREKAKEEAEKNRRKAEEGRRAKAEEKRKIDAANMSEEERVKKLKEGIAAGTTQLKTVKLTEEEKKKKEEERKKWQKESAETERRLEEQRQKQLEEERRKNPPKITPAGAKPSTAGPSKAAPKKPAEDDPFALLTEEEKKLPQSKQLKLAAKKAKIAEREAAEKAREQAAAKPPAKEKKVEVRDAGDKDEPKPQPAQPAKPETDQTGSGMNPYNRPFIAPIFHNGHRLRLGQLMTSWDMRGMGHKPKPGGKRIGLSTLDISDIMMKYWPIYRGTFAIDEFSRVPVKVSDGEAAMVINLSPARDKGTHWVALYIDFPNAEINYYDSYAEEPSLYFLHELDKLIDRANPDTYLKFKYNRVKQQPESQDSDTCGFHAMKFLVDRIRGVHWKDASGWSEVHKAEKKIKSFKHKYGYV